MKNWLRHFVYVGTGLLAGILIGSILVMVKWTQNQAETDSVPATVKAKITNTGVIADENISEENITEENITDGDISDYADLVIGDNIYEEDLVWFLGQDFSSIQSKFKTSEQILSAEYQYFKEECLAVVYDETSREVLCIEIDGLGTNPVTMLDLSHGMSREEAESLISRNMSNDNEITANENHIIVLGKLENVSFEADIEFENEKIKKITCRKK